MDIVWDQTKREANLLKHDLDFAAFDAGFSWDRFLIQDAKPSRMGRRRFLYVGILDGRLVVAAVVSPLGSEALSLVSLRHAGQQERRLYDEAFDD